MTVARLFRGHVCFGGPDVKMRVGFGVVKFEEHPYFGPMPTKKLGEKHPFWKLHEQWSRDGKNIGPDGFATFATPAALPTGMKEPAK